MEQQDATTSRDTSSTIGSRASESMGAAHGCPMYGRALRMVLVDELMHRPSMTVAQMVALVEANGLPVHGRTSKVISDALRWEVRRGRVERMGRGLYRYRRAPASTARRFRTFASACRRWLVAVRRDEARPPTPLDPRCPPFPGTIDSLALPPWWNTAWLWAT